MRIACLGWGSLIWDPRDLPVQGAWQHDGPLLPIEFARQSRDDRITLVCVPGYQATVQSLWALLTSSTVDTAREALRLRERIPGRNADRDIGMWVPGHITATTEFSVGIGAWASTLNLDAVLWTNLPPKFQDVDRRIPTAEEVIIHFSSLEGETRQKAEQYVRMTPRQIRTPYRTQIEQALQWFPDEGAP